MQEDLAARCLIPFLLNHQGPSNQGLFYLPCFNRLCNDLTTGEPDALGLKVIQDP